MPIRTTDTAVKAVMAPGGDYDLRRGPSLVPFTTAANSIVNRLVAAATDNETPIADADAALVETWLAAHVYCQSDRLKASKSTAGASASYNWKGEMGLTSTPYGVMAKNLDPSGLLEYVMDQSQGNAVEGFWLGTPDEGVV
jgi:hypothetical protein